MRVFNIAPGGESSSMIFGILAVVMVGIAVLMVMFAHSSRNLRFEVGASALAIKGDIYGRTIPYSQLVVSDAEILNLKDSEYRTKWKRNGSALPGFRSGWFTLRNGHKALVFLTDQTRAVRVPTRDGYELIVSPGEPSEFLAALKEAANRG